MTVVYSREKTNKILLMVLCCVMAPMVTSCLALEGYREAELKGREASLKLVLNQWRKVISDYTHREGKPPQKLDDLVKDGYINKIPEDPMTGKADWVLVFYNCHPSSTCKEGIKDLHSASKEKSSSGDLYSDW